MPVIKTIQAERGIDVGSAPSTRIDGTFGEGLRAVGGAISNAAEVQQQLETRRLQQSQQIDEFKANQELQRFGDDMSLEFATTQQNIDPSGKGFTDNVSGLFNKRAETFLSTVPDSLKPKFTELVKTSRNQWVDKAAAAEIDQRQTWYRTGITERQQTLQNQVFNDPKMFDAAKSDAYRTIEASGLPPVEKEALKKKTDEMFALTVGEREIRDAEANPQTAANAANRLGVVDTRPLPKEVQTRATMARDHFVALGYTPEQAAGIVGNLVQESGVRPSGAVGDNGTAFGLAQWRGERLTRLQRYANSQGADWKDFKTQLNFIDVELKNHETSAYKALKGAKTIDEATAAFVGYERPKGWTPQNPRGGHGFGNRLAAAQKVAGVEVTATATEADMDPRFKSLPLTQRLSLLDQVDAAAKRGQIAITAQATAEYGAQKGSIELGIQTGEVSSPEQILSSPMRDDDKASLLSALRTRQGDDALTATALADFQNGSLTVDPYSTDGKKVVDAIEKQIVKSVPEDKRQAALELLVSQTGVVPQTTLNTLRAGLESINPADIEAAAQLASRLALINPAALSRRDGGKEVQALADDFNHYVNNLNLSSAQAAQKIANNNNPDKKRDRKAMEPAAGEFKKQIGNDDVASIFDKSYLPFTDPAIGFTEGQALGIQAEYIAIAEEQFYQANGNVEIAKNRAKEEMKRLYGVTHTSGKPTVMKHPPEMRWPQITPQSALEGVFGDPLQYAKTQLYQDLYAIDPNIDTSTVQFVSTPQTDAMVKRGELPAYSVFYTDKNGVLQTLPGGKLWRPDPTLAVGLQDERTAVRNAALLDQARFMQDINRTAAEMKVDPLATREASQNAFIAGPLATPKSEFDKLPTPSPTVEENVATQRQGLMEDAQSSGLLDPMGNGF